MAQDIQVPENWKKPFFTVWAGQTVSIVGTYLVQFALVWWMTQTTGSAAVLATATAISILPRIFLGPFSGALIDRWNRKAVMILADASAALATLVLVVLFWTGYIQIWHIFVAEFVRAVASTLQWPAMTASTSLMVPEKHLSRVAGLNQTMDGVLNIVAPPLGAFLMSILSIHEVLAIDIVTASVAILLVLVVSIPQPARKLEGILTPRQLALDVREGFKYMATMRGMLIILGMATLINLLFTPAFSLLPLLVTRVFSGDAMQLGVINSAYGIGAIAGGLLVSIWGGFKRKLHTSMMGLIGMGVGSIAISGAPASLFVLAVGAMAFVGFFNPITNGPLFAFLQSKVKPEMQGRIFTIVQSGAAAASPIGLALAAPVADNLGIQFWFLIAGAVTVLMGIVGFMLPVLRQMEDEPQELQAVTVGADD